jgi:hypothetical protein
MRAVATFARHAACAIARKSSRRAISGSKITTPA